MEGRPPPPPPHGANTQGGRSGGLPDGKYDIFVIPPSSAGSGFLYLPSLQTQRNSFIAGVLCTAAAFFIWNVTVPAVKEWFDKTIHGGGSGVVVLLVGIGVLSWAFGKTQAEAYQGPASGAGSTSGAASGAGSTSGAASGAGSTSGASGTFDGAQPNGAPGAGPQSTPKSSWQRPPPQANSGASASNAKTSWEKAREETRKKEEEKRKMEELKKKREELEKERQKQREKDAREKIVREREAREREVREREVREREAREKDARERLERERREKEADKARGSPQRPPMPTARTEAEDDAYTFRPYDRPKRPYKANSAASIYSESSYAASQTTARTTPPPSNYGPYSTKDPDKIIIRGVYAFTNAFMKTPVQQLISGSKQVTDGLILRITTEGLFIDDDKRGVPQREWDVKAWTMKLVESCEMAGLHVLRASIRDQQGKKVVFVLSQSEGWKVAVGLQRLRRGTQVKALGVAGLPMNEAKALLEHLGYV